MTTTTKMHSFRLFYLFVIVTNIALTSAFQYSDEKIIPYSTIRMRRRLYAKRRHRNICNPENDEKNNEKLKEVIRNSDFVFTGKVTSYYVERETNSVRQFDKRESDRREKRRRLKKMKSNKTYTSTTPRTDESNAIDVLFDTREDKSEAFVVELKRVIKGGAELSGVVQTVVRVPKQFVSGLEITSDPTLNTNCVEFHPVMKLRSTAILLAKKVNGTSLLELTYFPVAMTLRHLDRVDAAVAGKKLPLFKFLQLLTSNLHT